MIADRYFFGDDLGTLEVHCFDCEYRRRWAPIWRNDDGTPTLVQVLAAVEAHEQECHRDI